MQFGNKKSKKTLYEILDVSTEATIEEIKKQYKKMAIRFHPDKNPGNTETEEKFKEIADAYQILSDYDKRKQYDYELQYGFTNDADNWVYSNVVYQDPNELFAQLFDNLSNNFLDNIFGEMMGNMSGLSNGNMEGHLYVGIQGMPVLNLQHLGVFENIIGMDAIESFGPLNINAKYDDVDLDISFSKKNQQNQQNQNSQKKTESKNQVQEREKKGDIKKEKSNSENKIQDITGKTTVIKESYPIGDFNALKTHKIAFKVDGEKKVVTVPLVNHKLLYPGIGKNGSDLLVKLGIESQSKPSENDDVQCNWVREKHNLVCYLFSSKDRYRNEKNGDEVQIDVPGKIKPVNVQLEKNKLGKTKKIKGLGLPKINFDDESSVVVVDDKLLEGLDSYRKQLNTKRGDLIFHFGTK